MRGYPRDLLHASSIGYYLQGVGYEINWEERSGVEEKGYDRNSGQLLVEVSPDFFRPSEVDLLIGDSSKAKKQLGWFSKTSIEELVRLMIAHDRETAVSKEYSRLA